MKTLVIYLDKEKKCYHKITPFAQGAEFDSKKRFDGNFHKLAEHFYGSNYYKTEIFG